MDEFKLEKFASVWLFWFEFNQRKRAAADCFHGAGGEAVAAEKLGVALHRVVGAEHTHKQKRTSANTAENKWQSLLPRMPPLIPGIQSATDAQFFSETPNKWMCLFTNQRAPMTTRTKISRCWCLGLRWHTWWSTHFSRNKIVWFSSQFHCLKGTFIQIQISCLILLISDV